jgi:hypothetical protein
MGGGMGMASLGMGSGIGRGGGTPAQIVTRDTVPLGEVDVRRGEPVRATDGDIGRVQGLVMDPASGFTVPSTMSTGPAARVFRRFPPSA